MPCPAPDREDAEVTFLETRFARRGTRDAAADESHPHDNVLTDSISARFERQVATYPHHVAIKTPLETLTYRELDVAANGVAQHILLHRDHGPEPIALLFEQGVALITAILGVLKAGKIFMPLNPTFPPNRLREILRHSGARALITSADRLAVADACANADCRVLSIEDCACSRSSVVAMPPIAPSTLASIMLTSGSSGEPKGVVQDHQTMLDIARRRCASIAITPDDCLLLLWLVPAWDIFLPLLNGATLALFNPRQKSLQELSLWLGTAQVSLLALCPTLFRALVESLPERYDLWPLRLVWLSGEPMAGRDIELFRKYFPAGCGLLNEFATTETGGATHFFVDTKTSITDPVPVGYALDGVEIQLLEASGKPVDVGDVGEIAITSRHVAKGYWRQPDLTRIAFLANSEDNHTTTYRTGDLGVMRPDGRLTHLGRADSQIKIRGYKVNIGAVEGALRAQRHVKEVTVVAHTADEHETRLVAYVVAAEAQRPSASVLRKALAQYLPDHMVPALYVFMPALPLLPSGKVDRMALPLPSPRRPDLDVALVMPTTSPEKLVASVWNEVLDVEPIGVHDNFLELGGDSLRATQAVARLEQHLRIKLSMTTMLQKPTIAELTETLRNEPFVDEGSV